jgi:uncharacterized protein with von Willebrand factor type A (vWA) domain
MDTLALRAKDAAARLGGFASFLHANGFAVGAGESLQVLDAAVRIGVLDQSALRLSLQALLCGRRDEWRRFDALFDAWFLPANRWQAPQVRERAHGTLRGQGPTQPVPREHAPEDDDDPHRPRDAASREQHLGSTDFRHLNEREPTLQIEALMRRLARRLRPVPVRREQHAAQGRRLDLRHTLRRSVATGGTPLRLAWRRPRRVRPRLVLLIDVSRSMAPYAFFYLRLARALGAELDEVRSFIFHTRITAVTQALQDPDPWRAQERLHLLAQGWGGGTRIGESLAQFNREHAPRAVHSRTAVLILSDGYDTGEPEQLSQALSQLRRRARRIVWLNPLLGRPGYAPLSPGMLAARPHLDLLASGADLQGIAAVLPQLLQALR